MNRKERRIAASKSHKKAAKKRAADAQLKRETEKLEETIMMNGQYFAEKLRKILEGEEGRFPLYGVGRARIKEYERLLESES